MRKVPSEELIEWPPSMPIRDAIRPDAQAASTSATDVARASSAAYRSVIRRTKSTCSKVAVTAASPASWAGTKTDQNCAPTPPSRSRGRSVWVRSPRAATSIRSMS